MSDNLKQEVGKPISRERAVQMAREIRGQAEAERIKAAEDEAKRGICYDDADKLARVRAYCEEKIRYYSIFPDDEFGRGMKWACENALAILDEVSP